MDPFTLHPRTVLTVDDDADMRLYLRGCLRTLGLSDVLEAADGAEALEVAHTVRVDLVISDVFMPRLDGYGLCKSLKANAMHESIPILLISGEADAERLGSTGADAFMTKPFNATMLEERITQMRPWPL